MAFDIDAAMTEAVHAPTPDALGPMYQLIGPEGLLGATRDPTNIPTGYRLGPQIDPGTPGTKGVPGLAPVAPANAPAASAAPNIDDLLTAAIHAPPTPPSTDKRTTGTLANIGAGTSEAAAGFLGLPVDLVTGALNLAPRAINAVAGTNIPTIQNPVGGSDFFKSVFGLAGADPRTIAPAGPGEQIARAAGYGGASMVLPWGLARGLPAAAGIPGAVQRMVGAGGAGSQATIGAGGGVGGQIGQDIAPDWAKPYANFLGQMVGGVGVALPLALGKAGLQAGTNLVRSYVQPLTATGQQQAAAQRIAAATTDLGATREALEAPQPLVPGSQPTTFQLTGDQGLGNLERAVAKNNPDLFMQRLGEQNAARVNALEGMAPTGLPPVPEGSVRLYHGGVDPTSGGARWVAPDYPYARDWSPSGAPTHYVDVPRDHPAVQAATDDINVQPGQPPRVVAFNAPEDIARRLRPVPTVASPDAVSAFFRGQLNDIDAAHTAQIEAARQAAREAVNNLGGTGELQNYGQRLRAGLDQLNQATRAQVSRLYDAVDPDGTLGVGMAGVQHDAASLLAEQPANAAPLTGEIGGIFHTAAGLPETQPFREAAALRSRITDAQREELYNRGRTQHYRMLTRLLASVDNTLSGSVTARAAAERGAVSPQRSTMARMQAALEQERNAWQEQRRSGVTGGGAGAAVPGQGDTAGRVGGLPGDGGGPRQAAGGPGHAPGDSGLATEAAATLTPFDEDAAARYRAANARHAERVATYQEAPGVGQVLGTGRRAGEWRLGDSQVPAAIFNSGKGAIERVQAFLRAGGSNAALVSDLRDYAAFDLRRAAENPDGTLDPGRTARWLAAHDQALSAFPELRARFQNAATARQMVDDAVARHVAARQAIEDSAARRFLGDADPVTTMGRILRSDTSEAAMRDLAARTALNPAARAGLQRAAVEFILQELRSNAIVGDERLLRPDAFTRFVQKSSPALGHIFSPEQVEAINNVAADLQRSQRSVSGTKLPGGSNTAQDLAAGNKHGGGSPSTLSLLAAMEAGGEALHHLLGTTGRIAGLVLAPAVNAMRQNGLKHVDDLVTQAMLHPELARTLLAKLPKNDADATGYAAMLGRQIRSLALQSALRARHQEPAPRWTRQ